jgi:hypothetical protein
MGCVCVSRILETKLRKILNRSKLTLIILNEHKIRENFIERNIKREFCIINNKIIYM